MSELLKITDLWGGYKEGVDILQGISMTVQEGEAVGIIGLNGSGKSTLGKAIMNMIPIRHGEIEFMGQSITTLSTHELANKGLAIMQQGGRVFPTLSVWENLEMAFSCKNKGSFDMIREIIPLLQCSKRELQHKMADKLSGGQKHQLALAMTLATQPKLVILDEPSAGLSPRAVEEMYEILNNIITKLFFSVLLIEQNISKAVSFCEKCLLLRQGTISKEFSGEGLKQIEMAMFNF